MGNCYGREGSSGQNRELTTVAAAGNGIVREVSAESRCEAEDTNGSEEVDSAPLPLSPGLETPKTQQKSSTPSTTEPAVATHTRNGSKRPAVSSRSLAHVQYMPPKKWSTCAYCCNPTGDRYGYFFCSRMTTQLLDTLMENGWWRTGRVLFKPCFPLVCCPGYTLRLPVSKFVLKKKHRRVIRRWARFLRHGDHRWENCDSATPSGSETGDTECGPPLPDTETRLIETAVASVGVEKVEDGFSEATKEEEESSVLRDTTEKERNGVSQSRSQQERQRGIPTPGRGADPNRPPCRKAKVMRQERRRQRLEAAGGGSPPPARPGPEQPPSLHDLLADHRTAATSSPDFKHRLTVKLLGCNPCHPDLITTLPQAYQLYDKFQESVHSGKTRFKSAEEFRWGFMTSPVVNPATHLEGSYHMHYYLDGQLTMISILDVLPNYFVSIYFIYDPAIRFLIPGVYTVLVELELAQQLQSQLGPRPQYYALGYYNCNPKVSYKAQFKPQEVLCNETNVFVKMDDAVSEKLSKMAYCRLAGDEFPEKSGRTASLDNLLVNVSPFTHGLCPVEYRLLDMQLQSYYSTQLRELVSETGTEAAEQMLISTSVATPSPST